MRTVFRVLLNVPFQNKKPSLSAWLCFRGTKTRTQDTRFWRPLLYQLSYTPIYLQRWYYSTDESLCQVLFSIFPRLMRQLLVSTCGRVQIFSIYGSFLKSIIPDLHSRLHSTALFSIIKHKVFFLVYYFILMRSN